MEDPEIAKISNDHEHNKLKNGPIKKKKSQIVRWDKKIIVKNDNDEEEFFIILSEDSDSDQEIQQIDKKSTRRDPNFNENFVQESNETGRFENSGIGEEAEDCNGNTEETRKVVKLQDVTIHSGDDKLIEEILRNVSSSNKNPQHDKPDQLTKKFHKNFRFMQPPPLIDGKPATITLFNEILDKNKADTSNLKFQVGIVGEYLHGFTKGKERKNKNKTEQKQKNYNVKTKQKSKKPSKIQSLQTLRENVKKTKRLISELYEYKCRFCSRLFISELKKIKCEKGHAPYV